MAKILVVDDSRAVRNLIQQRLGSLASKVVLAEDGASALEQVRSQSFDLVISDMDMPRMNGLRLCEELGAGNGSKPPVLVMVSDFDDTRVEQGFRVGVSGYIPKYNLGEELLPRVNEALKQAGIQALWSALVVDVSEVVRQYIEHHLGARGGRVETVADGQEALIRMQTLRPDLLIAEHRALCGDGRTLFDAVNEKSTLRGVPYLVLCTEDTRKAAMKLLQQGASSCLTKPFGPARLVRQAREAMSLARRKQERDNDLLNMQFDGVFRGVVEMVRLLEARDPTTNGHSQNVANLSRKIGMTLGLGPKRLRRLHLAGRLHDIGKVGLPDSILLKPASLTDDEYELVKQHSELGARLLEPFSGLRDIVPAVLQHHERFDGTGYPSGISGESIDIFARIIAVADTYDALTGTRPYRKPVDKDEALRTIQEVSGAQLCPKCVDALAHSLKQRTQGDHDAATAEQAAAEERLSDCLRGSTVVIADRNRMLFKEASRRMLEKGAASVVHAETGDEAWNALNREQADLLVCDWSVPGLACSELLERMAWSEDFAGVGTIVMAHNTGQERMEKIRAMKPLSVVPKPFAFDLLIDRVEEGLATMASRRKTAREAVRAESSKGGLSEIIYGALRRSSDLLNRFSQDTVCCYHERMLKYFASGDMTAPDDDIRKARDKYDLLVRGEFVDKCEKLLTHIGMATQNDEQAFRESMTEFMGESRRLLDGVSVDFLEHFRSNLLNCLLDKAEEQVDGQRAEVVVDEFRTDIRESSEQLHSDLSSMVNSVLDSCGTMSESECKLVLHKLVDAFGRGLMEPVNDFYVIEDHAPGNSQRDRSFPRQFCAPVLEVVRNYVIGREKYDKANLNILKSVRKFMGRDSGYEPEKLRVYFTHPKIRQYYVGFLLYCLKKLSSEVRRENFIHNVNNRLSEQGERSVTFDERAWSMLGHSWAHTVMTNMSDKQRRNKTVINILSRYLPN